MASRKPPCRRTCLGCERLDDRIVPATFTAVLVPAPGTTFGVTGSPAVISPIGGAFTAASPLTSPFVNTAFNGLGTNLAVLPTMTTPAATVGTVVSPAVTPLIGGAFTAASPLTSPLVNTAFNGLGTNLATPPPVVAPASSPFITTNSLASLGVVSPVSSIGATAFASPFAFTMPATVGSIASPFGASLTTNSVGVGLTNFV